MRQVDVLIVGGGPAGRAIAHILHERTDPASPRSGALVKNEPINVNRCAVPYGIPQDKPRDVFETPKCPAIAWCIAMA